MIPKYESSFPVMTVDLAAIRHNFLSFQDSISPSKVSAVVKADAYGLGMKPVSKTLFEAGCETFFVAYLEEGLLLREIFEDHSPTLTADKKPIIYVLEGLQPGHESYYLKAGLQPILGTPDSVERWLRLGNGQPCALHIDTGMARTGFEATEIASLISRLSLLPLSLVMSHYASSDDLSTPQNANQKQCFLDGARLFPGVPTCLASSYGVLLEADYWGDQVRIGLGLSGLLPNSGLDLKPAVTLSAKILQIREIEAGQPVGYNATWRADRVTRLATLGIGYADGLPRALSNKGAFYFGVHALPIRGAVSMDFTTVDVTDVSPHILKGGDTVSFFHDAFSLDQQAKGAQTISYELLTGIGQRCRRLYKNPGISD